MLPACVFPIIIMSGAKVEYEKLEEYVAKKAIPVMGRPQNDVSTKIK